VLLHVLLNCKLQTVTEHWRK